MITGSIVYGSVFASAKNPATDITYYKYYKSIEIKSGDTLWSLAEEYVTDNQVSTKDYINEITKNERLLILNNLKKFDLTFEKFVSYIEKNTDHSTTTTRKGVNYETNIIDNPYDHPMPCGFFGM